MFYHNTDYRNRVSLVIGIIIAALLKKYLFNVVFDLDSLSKNLIIELLETIFDVLLTITMIMSVYFIYPAFVKSRK